MLRAMASRGSPMVFLRPRVARANLHRGGAGIQCVRFPGGPDAEPGFFVVGGARRPERGRIQGTKGHSTRRTVACVSWRAFASHNSARNRRFKSSRPGAGDGETAVGALDGGVISARQAQTNRLHRFYVDELLPSAGGDVFLDGDESKHATKALRLKPGDLLEVCDGKGGVGLGEFVALETGDRGRDANVRVSLSSVSRHEFAGPKWNLVVACGGLKGGRADWLVEKSAEIGAHTLTPLMSERSNSIGGQREAHKNPKKSKNAKNDGDTESGREARWARVAHAASKQCLRAHALEIASPVAFHDLLTMIRESDEVVLLCAAGAPPLRFALEEKNMQDHGGTLLVGPEGDFTDLEIELLVDAGAVPVGLGPLRLRVETAAIAVMACVGMMHPREQPPGC